MKHIDVAVRIKPVSDAEWHGMAQDISIGKDVLELLSTSMYVDPLTVYREYIQNAADAIDEAREAGILGPREPGRVQIHIDLASRSIRIRDNGAGIRSRDFASRLTAIGNSKKRGTDARGFRGVGRLAGLGYARELIFRSQAGDETHVSELRWDCRRMRTAMRSDDFIGDLNGIIRECVSTRRSKSAKDTEHFFEVELLGLIRHRNDRLLDEKSVGEYLAQIAPVPFAPDFRFKDELRRLLEQSGLDGELSITLNDSPDPIYRPHRNKIELGKTSDEFTELEMKDIPDGDGGVGARAWILHHGYVGAISNQNLVKGLRIRVGNIQVGEPAMFDDLFPEPRFNSWAVGEIHILDKRIIPNGRRDHFEESVHLQNLLNHIAPIARDIAKRCRSSSIQRKALRQFELHRESVKGKIAVIRQGSVSLRKAKEIMVDTASEIDLMEKIATSDRMAEVHRKLIAVCETLRSKLSNVAGLKVSAEPLRRLSSQKRTMYENFFELIYECSSNRATAKALIDKLLSKVR
jgi:hypothetical protein